MRPAGLGDPGPTMQLATLARSAVLGLAASALLGACAEARTQVPAGQAGQPGQAASCVSQVQSGSTGQSNSSAVSQSAQGGAGGAGGSGASGGAAGGAGGEAACGSTVVQTNQRPGGSSSVTHLHGAGTSTLRGPLTPTRARSEAHRIARRLDPRAARVQPTCRRTGRRVLRCTVRWTPAGGGRGTLRVDVRRSGRVLSWRYAATIERG